MNLFDRTQDITVKRTEKSLGGYVYIVKHHNRIKIGRAVNPKDRVRAIETGAGIIADKIFITDKIYNSNEIESNVKKYTLRADSIGEWRYFDFDKIVDYIMNLNLEYSTPKEDSKRKIEMSKGTSEFFRAFRKRYEEEDYSVHCKHCCIPTEQYSPIEHTGDVGCELFDAFTDVVSNYEDNRIKTGRSGLKISFIKEINEREISLKDINIDIVLNKFIEIYDDAIGVTILI